MSMTARNDQAKLTHEGAAEFYWSLLIERHPRFWTILDSIYARARWVKPRFCTFLHSLYAREAEAMCDHVWIFEARTLNTQPVRRRCGMCGVYRMESSCREPGIQTHGGPDQEKPFGLLFGRTNPL
jgi:hypothetical protein